MADAAPPQESRSATALECLAAVAQRLGLPLGVDELRAQMDGAAGEPTVEKLLEIAERAGLRPERRIVSWDELGALRGAFPLLARLANGNTVVIAGLAEEGGERKVGVLDPLADEAALMFLPRERFCANWSGEIVLVRRAFRLADADQPFGLRWFVPQLLRERTQLRDIGIAALALHVIALAVPIFFQLVVDKVLVHQSYATLYVLAVGTLLALAFEAAIGYIRQALLLRATNRIDMRLAARTFEHLVSLPMAFFDAATAGVVARHMQQTERIRQFLTGRLFFTLLEASALVVFVPLLLLYSARLTLVVLAFAALLAVVVALVVGPYRARLRELYTAEAERQAMLIETIHGMRPIKSMALESVQKSAWEQRAAWAIDRHFRVGRISIAAQSVLGFVEKLLPVAVIGFGAQLVFDQALTVGELIAFQMISGRVVGPLVQVATLMHEYQETALSIRMLGEVMNAPREARLGVGGLRPKIRGAVAFEGVTFRYPGRGAPALDAVTLEMPTGSLVGIVGRSGSGKTTLARLVQGMYPVQEGTIRIDGVDIRAFDITHLRRNIGVVLQDDFLFRGTVRENIAIAQPGAPMEAVVAAAQMAGADEFIERLPDSYETMLGEGGVNLSGGQRQRLCIARAVLRRPPLLILDEATSSLDPESEAVFLRGLSRLAAERTVIMISHRLSTLTSADEIIVLDEGRIVGRGRHEELLRGCPTYSQLWTQQQRHLAQVARS